LTFEKFGVPDSDTVSGVAFLAFNPNLQATWDDQLVFEAACTVPESGVGACPDFNPAQITVTSHNAEFPWGPTTSPVYKNIDAGVGGQLTEFQQCFSLGGTIPEPVSLVLLGSGLLGLGLLRRRSRKKS